MINRIKRTIPPIYRSGRFRSLPGIALLAAWAGLAGCSGEIPLVETGEEGEPIRISSVEITNTKSAVSSTGTNGEYDHDVFVANDQIRIRKVWSEGNSAETYATYTLGSDATTWTSANPLTLQPGATYQGFFPATASPAIHPDQTSRTNYVSSDHLQTLAITAPTGVLNFTSDNAFMHQNAKLTLVLKLASSTSTDADAGKAVITDLSISAQGIVTEANANEMVKPYRVSTEKAVFSAILRPLGATTITVRLTYSAVSYTTTIASVGLAKGTHYVYTLTIEDKTLVPEGSEITGWKDEDIYSGAITTASSSKIKEGGVL